MYKCSLISKLHTNKHINKDTKPNIKCIFALKKVFHVLSIYITRHKSYKIVSVCTATYAEVSHTKSKKHNWL